MREDLVALDPVFAIPYRQRNVLQLVRSWELNGDWWSAFVKLVGDPVEAKTLVVVAASKLGYGMHAIPAPPAIRELENFVADIVTQGVGSLRGRDYIEEWVAQNVREERADARARRKGRR
ncbi:hypothetical protein [Microbacterium sp. NPDC089695]|uniref:hypothetical protein n=1 Tax=Microbacterium sp. NPDC089695 TaxID=3364198 RepID=UPI003811F1C2